MVAVPGLDDGCTPFYLAFATFLRTYSAWTENADPGHDWALVTLDRRIGNVTGWMGRQSAASTSGIYTGVLNLAGYPGDKGGDTMWFDSDLGVSANELNHLYLMDTGSGQSGAPVWRFDGASRYIITIHTTGVTSGGVGVANIGTVRPCPERA